jgi:hypothetical protein
MLLFGGMMVNRVDIQHFLDMRRSALVRALRQTAAALRRSPAVPSRYPPGDGQRADRPHGDARLAQRQLRLNVNVLSLSERNGEVTGVEIEHEGQKQTLEARCGVVLAAGGFAAGRLANAIGHIPASTTPCRLPPTMAPRCVLPPRSMPAKGRPAVQLFLGAGLGFTASRRHARALPHLVTDRAKPE